MGIDGLHQATKHFIKQVHVSKYKGKRVGVDASAWLNKGAVPHAWYICGGGLGQEPWKLAGQDPPWVDFPMKMIMMLRACGVEPVMVFDGRRSLAKAPTNQARQQRKQRARSEAQAYIAEGREDAAKKTLMQCVDVTPDMGHDLIIRLQEHAVPYVVAPYEADAQLAHMAAIPEDQGGVSAVITEDSDLIAYGCPVVLFKCTMDGNAEEMHADVMFADVEVPEPSQQNSGDASDNVNGSGNAGAGGSASGGACASGSGATAPAVEGVVDGSQMIVGGGGAVAKPKKAKAPKAAIDFKGWNAEMIRTVCVMAGCDFLKSIKSVGFKTAHGLVAKGRSLAGTLSMMHKEKRWQGKISEQYAADAELAAACFAHAMIFDIRQGKCDRLAPLPKELETLPHDRLAHMGLPIEDNEAMQQACGWLNPHTLAPFDANRPLVTSSWQPTARPCMTQEEYQQQYNANTIAYQQQQAERQAQQQAQQQGQQQRQQQGQGQMRRPAAHAPAKQPSTRPAPWQAPPPMQQPIQPPVQPANWMQASTVPTIPSAPNVMGAEARRELFGMSAPVQPVSHHHHHQQQQQQQPAAVYQPMRPQQPQQQQQSWLVKQPANGVPAPATAPVANRQAPQMHDILASYAAKGRQAQAQTHMAIPAGAQHAQHAQQQQALYQPAAPRHNPPPVAAQTNPFKPRHNPPAAAQVNPFKRVAAPLPVVYSAVAQHQQPSSWSDHRTGGNTTNTMNTSNNTMNTASAMDTMHTTNTISRALTSQGGSGSRVPESRVPETDRDTIDLVGPSDDDEEEGEELPEVTSPLRPSRNPTLPSYADAVAGSGGGVANANANAQTNANYAADAGRWQRKKAEAWGGSSVSGVSSGSGGSKRKSGDGGVGGKGSSKKKAAMEAAAANCMRISSYFGR